jgi:hypothetical protein
VLRFEGTLALNLFRKVSGLAGLCLEIRVDPTSWLLHLILFAQL